ncbi:unnamed protein product [Allacma fusca]|uniref:MYND-type domain-containing protein n=1 Tax=Allacma fusca TaxID=39272 RepID=A0A8J2LBY8_9HEXA|nr:unnamed protein product [Allacma fusca]
MAETGETPGGETEATIFTLISKDDVQGVTEILRTGSVNVDIVDEHGMTPLQHAAYRGNETMCRMLLDRGADVNGGNHNNNYTALHFAALSGKSALCQVLLQAGAKSHAVNSVGRTPAQMAAFVGNHGCVSTINNFVDRKDVEYFTSVRGLETDPKLQSFLVSPVHNLIMQINFHPVRVALYVKKNNILLEHIPEVIQVLKLISEREMKKGADANEITAFKIHLLSFILTKMQEESVGAKGHDPVENFIKKMLRCKTPGGIPEQLDILLREGVRAFPFRETTIMQQLVTNLAHTKLCEDPGAWGIISSVVNGHKGFRDNDPCATCGDEKGSKKCSRCHFDAYCDKDCQLLHWFVHKKYCKAKAEEWAKRGTDTSIENPEPIVL